MSRGLCVCRYYESNDEDSPSGFFLAKALKKWRVTSAGGVQFRVQWAPAANGTKWAVIWVALTFLPPFPSLMCMCTCVCVCVFVCRS